VKYLGIIIYHKLSFTEHIITIAAKVARSIGILSKIKHFLLLNNSLIFLYGLIVWGHSYTTYLEPLKKLQNKAIRIVAVAKWDEPSVPLYKLLKFETSKFIHKNLTIIYGVVSILLYIY